MPYRKVQGLYLARKATCPHQASRAPRGVKALGLVYERAVARALPGALHGQWFYFEDANGPGYCQPDLLVQGWILEVKLSDTQEALGQLTDLYLPVVTAALGGQWRGLKIVKYLQPWSRDIITARDQALTKPPAVVPTLHWPGKGRLP